MKLSLSLSSFLYTLLRTTGYFVYQPILVDNLSDNNGIPSIPTIVSYHLFIKITFIYQLPTANCQLPTAKLPDHQTSLLPYLHTSNHTYTHHHIFCCMHWHFFRMPRNKYTTTGSIPPSSDPSPREPILPYKPQTLTNSSSSSDTIEDPMSSQKMMRNNSIPEPSESPKSQLHDAIERIQSLHKRRAQIKTIYENERQYLDQRSQKTKSSFEGLIVSTEEQIQSINEVSFLTCGVSFFG